jgi:hypothetical protein
MSLVAISAPNHAPLSHRSGGLGGYLFLTAFSFSFFSSIALGLLCYFYRKTQISTISDSPELPIFSDRNFPMRLTAWAQLLPMANLLPSGKS